MTRCAQEATRPDRRAGLLAGWGRLPFAVADALRGHGYSVYCLGIKDHADPQLAEHCDEFRWVGLAQLGRAARFFRSRGVSQATMAGKVHKVRLFQAGALWRHWPDWLGLRTFAPHFLLGRSDRKDDTLLTAVVDAFAKKGIVMAPATEYAPHLLVSRGCLTRNAPSERQWADIRFGWRIAKEMGRLDVGQSVVVKDRATIAIEAIEGTDLCIRRAGELCTTGGMTVVKVAKPNQDMRFDVPTVGTTTLESMSAAGAKVLAIEADRTILLEPERFICLAEERKLIVVAVAEGKDM